MDEQKQNSPCSCFLEITGANTAKFLSPGPSRAYLDLHVPLVPQILVECLHCHSTYLCLGDNKQFLWRTYLFFYRETERRESNCHECPAGAALWISVPVGTHGGVRVGSTHSETYASPSSPGYPGVGAVFRFLEWDAEQWDTEQLQCCECPSSLRDPHRAHAQ